MFVIVNILIIGALFITMQSIENDRQDLVGLRAVHLMKSYDEAEKMNLYLDLASKYASRKTMKILAENGGYNEEADCEKTQKTIIDQEQYIILNTCQILNPEKEFEAQFKKELKLFVENYKSSYAQTGYAELFGIREAKQTDYNGLYTNAFRNSNMINSEDSDNNLIIILSDISLPVEAAENSFINIKPKTRIKKQDFKVYGRLNLAIRNSCINKSFSECEQNLKQKFQKIQVQKEENLVKVSLQKEDFVIKLAFNINQEIPTVEFDF